MSRRAFVLGLIVPVLLAACGGGAPTLTPVPTPTVPIVTLPPRETVDEALAAAIPTDHVQGAEDAAVTIIHYADFQCVPCADMARSLAILLDRYPDTVRVIWRHFPDTVNHDKAALALLASEAAGEQGFFWEMHDLLFAEQATWRDQSPQDFQATLVHYAGTLNLDLIRFQARLAQDPAPLVDQYRLEALAFELAGIPSLLINGQPYSGRYDLYGLDDAVRFFALAERHYDDGPDLVVDMTKTYRAVLATEHGDITIDLFLDRAPVTVNNFVFLAREGWYDDITFHRVLPGLFAQTGDPSGTGLGGPGYNIFDERGNGLAFDREGLVAMASTRSRPNSGGSQFFITYGPLQPAIDYNGQFAIFGLVTGGMDVLRQLTPRDPLDPALYPDPLPGDRLIRVEIIEE